MEKRKEERRKNRKLFVLKERRDGFDRRATNQTVGYKLAWELRNNQFLLACVLLLINALNLADLFFTILALRAGHGEANPFLRYLFLNLSPTAGGYVKIASGVLVTLAIWILRKYRRVLETALLILAIYFLIFLFHLYVTLSMV